MEYYKEIIFPIIEIILPMIIAVVGWIVVHDLNNQNMKEVKRLALKSDAYKELKEKDKKMIHSHIKFISFIDQTSLELTNFIENNNVSNINNKNLMDIYKGKEFKNLMFKCRNESIEYLSTWERNKIIFKNLEKEKYALQEEYKNLSNLSSKVFRNYLKLFIAFTNEEGKNIDLENLNKDLIVLSEKLTDYISCVYDVNYILQNIVYGDLFAERLERKKALENKYLTIDSLLEKHKENIDKIFT